MLKIFFLILINFILILNAAEHDAGSNMTDGYQLSDELQLRNQLFRDINSIKYSIEDIYRSLERFKECDGISVVKDKTFFDIRIDHLPEICQTPTLPNNCAEATHCTHRSGIYTIQIQNPSILVECDATTQDGDWTVIQKRHDGSVDFFRDWSDYKHGFGNVHGEYFIGLDNLYALTNQLGPQELLIIMDDDKFAKYDSFLVGNETEKYKLKSLGKYSGTAGDSLVKGHIGMQFTTKDQDNDLEKDANCAVMYTGAWWYNSCHASNLNGKFGDDSYGKGINWWTLTAHNKSLLYVKMMVRRRRI